MSDPKPNRFARIHAATEGMFEKEYTRNFGLALAKEVQSQVVRRESSLHHEESYVGSELRGIKDNNRLIEYMSSHTWEIETIINEALMSPSFKQDRPVIIRLKTAAGDHPVKFSEVMKVINDAADNMQRVSIVDASQEIVFEQVPIEAYCYKREESGSKQGTISAYIVDLTQINDNYDAMHISRHADITIVGLMGLLRDSTPSDLSDGKPVDFVWKQVSVEIPPSSARLLNYSLTNPTMEQLRDQSVLSGKEIVDDFIAKNRKMSTREIIEIPAESITS